MLLAQMFPGMEYIPLQILVFSLALISGIISVVAGLLKYQSKVAYSLGACSVFLAIVPTIAWILLIGSRMFIHAYFITVSPAALGSIGVALSYRQKWQNERLLVVFHSIWISTLVLGAVGYYSYSRHCEFQGKSRVLAIFSGSNKVTLTEIKLEWQQREVQCSNQKILRYLESQMGRGGQLDRHGASYRTTFIFQDGNRFTADTDWQRDGVNFSIDDWDGETTHVCSFNNLPAEMEEMVEFIDASYEKVAGQILRITDEGSSVTYDQRLDLR